MRGRYERRTWQHDPTSYAPARFRSACHYDVFLPQPLAGFEPPLAAATVGVVSDAERRLQRLGAGSAEALGPLARLLLRTESIASSKVEGLQVDARDLARGEARAGTGGKLNPTAAIQATDLAASYLDEVAQLTERWRAMLRAASDPRADAAAWAIIDVLPAQPVVTSAMAGAVTGRSKAPIHNALEQLADAGVLVPIAGGRRNRSWEAAGLLDLIADLEAGELPT
jgi:hypothetical protein